MHVQSGKHIVASSNPAFQPFKDGEGNRYFDHVVKFEQGFESPPQVLVSLNHLDGGPEVKLHVAAEKVTASGFVLRYSTWADARVVSVGAQWFAFHTDMTEMTLAENVYDLDSD